MKGALKEIKPKDEPQIMGSPVKTKHGDKTHPLGTPVDTKHQGTLVEGKKKENNREHSELVDKPVAKPRQENLTPPVPKARTKGKPKVWQLDIDDDDSYDDSNRSGGNSTVDEEEQVEICNRDTTDDGRTPADKHGHSSTTSTDTDKEIMTKHRTTNKQDHSKTDQEQYRTKDKENHSKIDQKQHPTSVNREDQDKIEQGLNDQVL